MQYTYTPPEFLQNQSVEDIHKRMLAALPDGIDKSEMQIPWDFTRPAAMEKAEFVEYELNETIKQMFPQWATGEWLDKHAETEGLKRIPPVRAFGEVLLTGNSGTYIPQGTQFASTSSNVVFETTEHVNIKNFGTPKGNVKVSIRALEGGSQGNLPIDDITLILLSIDGLDSVTNEQRTTGGAEAEHDDDLRTRILTSMRLGGCFTGCNEDYVQWAKATPDAAVGQVIVYPECDGPGTVRLYILDKDGRPACSKVCLKVKKHIMGESATDPKAKPDGTDVNPADAGRLAPIGVKLTVEQPPALKMNVTANVVLTQDIRVTIDSVTQQFKAALENYWMTVAAQGTIRHVAVGALLANTQGVADYSNLLINENPGNITLEDGQYPVSGEVILI